MTEPPEKPPAVPSRAALLEEFVARQAGRLWLGYQADRGDAVAELAQLRRGLPRGGALPVDAWGIFGRGFPESLVGAGDEASPEELAAASALALYALHQQSRRSRSMHERGYEHALGRSVSRLRQQLDSEGVERRFQALLRASSFDAVLEHVRAYVGLLRVHEIPLDYARLASDLRAVHHVDGHRCARVRWSRDFYRSRRDDSTGERDNTDPISDVNSEES